MRVFLSWDATFYEIILLLFGSILEDIWGEVDKKYKC